MRRLILALAGCVIGWTGQSALAGSVATSEYVFIPRQSAIAQTGGIAGVHWVYALDGRFRLKVDPDAGVASFTLVDANAVGDGRTLDPNEVFNLTGLTGTVVSDTSIRFTGKVDDGSSVLLTATFDDDLAHLTGGTTPPPGSADFFVFSLDAVAQRKYAGGVGEPNDPYQIATAADLIALGETLDDYDKHFILTADIDLDPNLPGGKVFDKAVIAPDWQKGFTGVFDGNGHKVSHMTITGVGYLGLFGWLSYPASVSNLRLDTVEISGSDYYVGALVGYNEGLWLYNEGSWLSERCATVANCDSTGSVIAGSWVGTVGGLVGYNAGNMTHCSTIAVVTGGDAVGGLVGWNAGTITASNSSGSVGGGDAVGGLVGLNLLGTISASRSSGSVTGNSGVGGLVGWNGSVQALYLSYAGIRTSYSTSSVNGKEFVGGLVGCNTDGSIATSYSNGSVSGSKSVGGLLGQWEEDYGSVTSCFWDIQTSGQTTSAGGTGKTVAEMQAVQTFLDADWDFLAERGNGTEDTWWILEGRDYPRLWWEKVLGDDFADGKAEPQWMVYEVDPELVQIREVNGRLEASASVEAQNVDAFYVSQGWRLDVTKDFAIRVDYHFTKQGGDDGRVTIGLVPSLDLEAMQWAEFEVGCFESGPFYLHELRDGYWVQEQTSERSADDGTLFVSYNPAADELYFSHTGYGKPNAWRIVTGLLAGRWASEPVYVILGGGSEGLAFTGSEAWLDRFAIQAGVILQGSTHLATQSTAHTSHETQVGSFNPVDSTRIPKAILGNDLKVYN